MAGLGRKVFTRERATVADVQGYLMDQSVMVFASVSARNAAIPSSAASAGMVTYLADTKVYEDYINGAWRRRSGSQLVSYAAGTLTATNNRLMASLTVNPGRPYRVLVHAAINTLPSNGSQGALRIFDKTTSGTTVRNAETLTFSNPDANISRTFDVPGGELRTFEANLEALVGSFQHFTNETHSFLEATWWAA